MPVGLLRNSIAIYFSRADMAKTVDNLVKALQARREDPLLHVLAAIAVGLLTAFGVAALIEMLKLLLKPR